MLFCKICTKHICIVNQVSSSMPALLYYASAQEKAEKRRFHRLVAGLTIGMHQRERMRFMTLTTAPGVEKDINKSFVVLKLRIWRTFGWKFNRYFKLKTAEGNGVLHIVYRGKFIPQSWLSYNWAQIHGGSFIVDIRELHVKNGLKPLANYLIVNYLTKQKTIRMSYGWRWCWLGFCKSYKNIKEEYNHMKVGTTITQLRPFGVGYYVCFKDRFRHHGLDAWKSKLWEPSWTSRQKKLDKFF
jgi:hypothetical protein